MRRYTDQEKINLCTLFYKEIIKKYFVKDLNEVIFNLRQLNNLNYRQKFYANLNTDRTLSGIIQMLYKNNYIAFNKRHKGFNFSLTSKYKNLIKSI